MPLGHASDLTRPEAVVYISLCACEGALPAFLWLAGLSGSPELLQCLLFCCSVSDGVFVDQRETPQGVYRGQLLLANSSPLSPPTDYCTRIAFSL